MSGAGERGRVVLHRTEKRGVYTAIDGRFDVWSQPCRTYERSENPVTGHVGMRVRWGQRWFVRDWRRDELTTHDTRAEARRFVAIRIGLIDPSEPATEVERLIAEMS